jgi:hypothetical protein
MTDENGQSNLEVAQARAEIKKQIQDTKQAQAEIEAEKERQKKEWKDKEEALKKKNKTLQEAIKEAEKGTTEAQYAQYNKDTAVVSVLISNITEEWNKSRSAILKASKFLYEAKLGVQKIHGATWKVMVEEKLPFGVKTADRLVEIGGCEFIHTNADDLPAAYTTLYEIAKLDADVRQKAFDAGKINSDSWRRDIIALTEKADESTEEESTEEESKVRTLPIGILNVPVSLFQEEIEENNKVKTRWLGEKVKLFQAECANALKEVIAKYKVVDAPPMIDFSKINETLEKQTIREEKKVVIDYAADQEKVCRKLKKAIKEGVKKGSWKDKYTGSAEKVQNLNADLLSKFEIGYLAASLTEVNGAVDWGTFETGHITEEMLISFAGVGKGQTTAPGA